MPKLLIQKREKYLSVFLKKRFPQRSLRNYLRLVKPVYTAQFNPVMFSQANGYNVNPPYRTFNELKTDLLRTNTRAVIVLFVVRKHFTVATQGAYTYFELYIAVYCEVYLATIIQRIDFYSMYHYTVNKNDFVYCICNRLL